MPSLGWSFGALLFRNKRPEGHGLASHALRGGPSGPGPIIKGQNMALLGAAFRGEGLQVKRLRAKQCLQWQLQSFGLKF